MRCGRKAEGISDSKSAEQGSPQGPGVGGWQAERQRQAPRVSTARTLQSFSLPAMEQPMEKIADLKKQD